VTSHDIAGRIAHDLKAALSPIRTSAYVLRQGKQLPDATHQELLEVIERQTLRLARMIDEAIDWQRAMAGTLVSRRAPHDMAMLLDLVIGALPSAPVVTWPQGDVPAVTGDRHRLEQMLVALVECCAQRDPTTPPQIEVTSADGFARVSVSDLGPPVDLDALTRAPLYDAPDAGLGLGVLLAQAIAQAHKGELRVHARTGGGICFECLLPLQASTAA